MSDVWGRKADPPALYNGILAAGKLDDDRLVFLTASPSTRVIEYNQTTNTWSTHSATLPSDMQSTDGCVIDGVLYIFGGSTVASGGASVANVWAWDQSDTWTAKAALPAARQMHAVAALNGKAHICGGYNAVGTGLETNTHWEYDPATNAYTTRAVVPLGRVRPAMAAVGSKLNLLSGVTTGAGSPTLAHHEWDPGTDAWTAKANSPLTVEMNTAAAIGTKLYVLFDPAFREWDQATNTWATRANYPTSHLQTRLSVLDDLLLYAPAAVPKQFWVWPGDVTPGGWYVGSIALS